MASAISLTRHQAQCTICRSPLRDEIDARFIAWVPPWKIVEALNGVSLDSLYRHARACGLFKKRRENAILGVETIAETAKSDSVRLSALRQIMKYYEKNRDNQEPSTDSTAPTTNEKPEELGREISSPTGSKVETTVDFHEADVIENKGYGEAKVATNSSFSAGDSSSDSAKAQAPAAPSQTATMGSETTTQIDGRGATDEPKAPLSSEDKGHVTSIDGSNGDGGVSALPASTTLTETVSVAADGPNDSHEERDSRGSETKIGCESAPCPVAAQTESSAPATDLNTAGGNAA